MKMPNVVYEECNENEDTVLTKAMFKDYILKNTNDILLFKFSASWCGPCLKLKPIIQQFISKVNEIETQSECKVKVFDVDVDSCFELYAFLKSKKRVNGIPAIFVYYPNTERDESLFYLPDDSTSGIDIPFLEIIFNKIKSKI